MKRFLIIVFSIVVSVGAKAYDNSFGQITITPYVAEELGLDANCKELLNTKLAQITTVNNVSGGFDRRFVLTININVLDESETATIPQKTSVKTAFTFFVGDGVSGALFGSQTIELTGVGDSRNDALFCTIRKINVKDENLQALIKKGKTQIVEYYNAIAP